MNFNFLIITVLSCANATYADREWTILPSYRNRQMAGRKSKKYSESLWTQFSHTNFAIWGRLMTDHNLHWFSIIAKM